MSRNSVQSRTNTDEGICAVLAADAILPEGFTLTPEFLAAHSQQPLYFEQVVSDLGGQAFTPSGMKGLKDPEEILKAVQEVTTIAEKANLAMELAGKGEEAVYGVVIRLAP